LLILVGKWGKQGFPQAFPNVVFDKRLFIHLLVFWLEIKKPPRWEGLGRMKAEPTKNQFAPLKRFFAKFSPRP
jgi:hypothetical protein